MMRRYLSSCQNMLVFSSRKGRKSFSLSSRPDCFEPLHFSSTLEIKIEVATWTIIDGSGSSVIACSSLCIHGSIFCSILSLSPLFATTFLMSKYRWRNLSIHKINYYFFTKIQLKTTQSRQYNSTTVLDISNKSPKDHLLRGIHLEFF